MATVHSRSTIKIFASPLIWLACLRRRPLPGVWLGRRVRHIATPAGSHIHAHAYFSFHHRRIMSSSSDAVTPSVHALRWSIDPASLFEVRNPAHWMGICLF